MDKLAVVDYQVPMARYADYTDIGLDSYTLIELSIIGLNETDEMALSLVHFPDLIVDYPESVQHSLTQEVLDTMMMYQGFLAQFLPVETIEVYPCDWLDDHTLILSWAHFND